MIFVPNGILQSLSLLEYLINLTEDTLKHIFCINIFNSLMINDLI